MVHSVKIKIGILEVSECTFYLSFSCEGKLEMPINNAKQILNWNKTMVKFNTTNYQLMQNTYD